MFGLFKSQPAHRDIGPVAAQELIAAGAPAVDVREPAEFAAGAIQGSINVPLGAVQMQGIAALRNAGIDVDATHLVLICRSGNRSGVACGVLRDALGERAHNLAGGVIAWAQQGMPLTPGGV
ncbi:MAG: rhodanese-like domain-containing protein [Rhodanobacteraceae bacterium]|nr:rhodanese-like domain-containing protein [Rhodanobacteraceae bacterium]